MSDAQYREGGGNLPAYQEDFFQRIVNVSWATGVIFIVGDNGGKLYYGDFQSKASQKWTVVDVGLFPPSGGGWILFSSYAYVNKNPVFVLLTEYYNTPAEADLTNAAVMASHDGKSWRKVYDNPQIGLETAPGFFYSEWEDPTGVVWDDLAGAFYFSSFATKQVTGEGFSFARRLYRSTDGFSWSRIDEDPWIPEASTGATPIGPNLIKPHCRKSENRGEIPDGLQAYNKKDGTFMKPKDLTDVGLGSSPEFSSNPPSPQVAVDPKTSSAFNASVSAPCLCVGGINGMWLAGGGSGSSTAMLDSSFDDGKTWSASGAPLGTAWVTTIIAAPKKEVKSGK